MRKTLEIEIQGTEMGHIDTLKLYIGSSGFVHIEVVNDEGEEERRVTGIDLDSDSLGILASVLQALWKNRIVVKTEELREC